ncbi:MAG: magnesium transporter CorA family protein [Rhodospirillales bacterium]|nr:magnesium transporter CorA family protein [Alphaproteobacteria bacterium]MCB9986397.1 magnesium transporter CorA family protein [Rhodospirillales bacterium]USO07055.1 MAG: magnesium transporter CorA family protein [Rhodospirillales bacterium]
MAHIYSTRSTNVLDIDNSPVLLEDDVIWLDLLRPTPEEEQSYESQLGIDIPLREELKSIEPSSRLYKEDGAIFMTATVVSRSEAGLAEAAAIGFILHNGRLITVRYTEPRAFDIFSAYVTRHPHLYEDGASLLTSLLEAIVDRAAEIMEGTNLEIDRLSADIFAARADNPQNMASGEKLGEALKEIAMHQNLMSKIRDSLVSLGRVVRFLGLADPILKNKALKEQLRSVDRDITSLTDQASFIGNNITFLLDASLGLISIEQNAIIKIFSVAAVAFLPPTLVASIYGMNFRHMPELAMEHGYLMALMMMLASAVVPYLYFKHRRWL